MSALKRSENDIIRLASGDDLRTYLDTISGHGPIHEAVIEVEGNDDLTSIRSKLESVRVPRAVIVIPSQAKVLRDGVEFRVLRRLQRDLGLDFAIISDDIGRRALATENGFRHVYRSMRSYYRSKSSQPDTAEIVPFSDPEEFSPALSISRWGVLIGTCFALLLAGLAYILVPIATVRVYPETQTMARDIEILVEIGGPRMDVTAQRLSGRLIEERATVEGSININEVSTSTPPGSSQPSGLQPDKNITLSVRDELRNRMLQQATAQAAEKLRRQLKSNESMPEASIRTEVSTERYDHNVGDIAETLNGTVEVVATGLAFNNDDFNKLVQTLWSQDIPQGYKALSGLDISPPNVTSSEERHLSLKVRATGTLMQEIDSDAIIAAVRGKTISEARQQVTKVGDFSQPADVTIWPDWASRALRVQVTTMVKRAPPSQ